MRRATGTKAQTGHRLVVGVDTGGTFTDVVFTATDPSLSALAAPDGGRGRLKVLSTPHDPAEAVLAAFSRLFGERAPDLFTYGTTVATNAMLERRGARTALVTTAGFEDVLEIGRQARPELYDLEPRRPEPLVDASRRLGVRERILHDGSVATPLKAAEIRRIVAALGRMGIESVAVCLLHSPNSPEHEKKLGQALARLGVPVTLSHEISPTVGEYERTSTSVANAYVQPKVAGHIRALAEKSRARRLRVMQSSGGAIGSATAEREPVRTMLSGPAGGVAAAAAVAARAGVARLVTVDMGGTSTDVAFVDGVPPRRADTWIGGVAIRVPCLDIHTVGAGGGSIAFVDEGGALRVGPLSAGADPGPACYGRGTSPTVTDANVVLGRLPAGHFLGGAMNLDVGRARRALDELKRAMRVRSVEEAAEGVVRVVEGNMERAIRAITVQRGQDPRSAVLFPFGGAAGLHACGLADEMGFPEILVPRDPGLLSAIGILDGRVVVDRLVPLSAVDPAVKWLEARAATAVHGVRGEVIAEGFAAGSVEVATFVRARYQGQSIEIEVPLTSQLRRRFDEAHQRLFHSADAARPLEVVGLRVSASGSPVTTPPRRRKVAAPGRRKAPAPLAVAPVVFGAKARATPILDREKLAPGTVVQGPAVLVEYSSTTVVAPDWSAVVDGEGNLRLTRRARH
ncbi:MAG: hydantoinase/oxoprolinase family protein [Candidatus Binatia bacterium]